MGRRIVLTVLALMALALGALAWRFREELRALQTARQYSAGELQEQLNGTDQTIRDAVDASSDITVRAPTDEEKQALRDGILTQDELVGRLTGGEQSDAPASKPDVAKAPEKEESSSAETAREQEKYQQKLSELIAKVYVLREEYTNALEDMETAAKADYYALPDGQRSVSKLAPLVSSYLAKATALEKECDGKMDEVIAEMERLIKENNGDMSLTDTVFNTYVKEKSIKKAWYLSRLKEKGLV